MEVVEEEDCMGIDKGSNSDSLLVKERNHHWKVSSALHARDRGLREKVLKGKQNLLMTYRSFLGQTSLKTWNSEFLKAQELTTTEFRELQKSIHLEVIYKLNVFAQRNRNLQAQTSDKAYA
ncbi:conserved hypothetical protein [Ricinus communis]|uniref:Uncharacterized protein n=1 Tax=Ricinus communis TaxID=3988 RepID=B9S9S5_RICCO|nr:conserved hypothetical protein [Ricinus communis]